MTNTKAADASKPLIPLSVGFLLVVFLAWLYYSRNKNFSVDDSFITFTYTSNLVHGNGLVFNVGERYYGTTALGYAVLLAASYRAMTVVAPAVTIPNVSVLLSAIALAGTCLMLLWASLKSVRQTWLIAPLFIAFTLFVFCGRSFNEVAGHETSAFLAVSLAATLLAAFQRPFSAGFVLAMAATLRPDALLFAPLIGAGILLNGKNLLTPWRSAAFLRFSLGLLLLMVPWWGWTTFYFGSPIPGTLEAKQAQVPFGYWAHYDLATVFSYLQTHVGVLLLALCLVAVGCLVVRIVSSRGRAQRLIGSPMTFVVFCWTLFCVFSVSIYCFFDVSFWKWYGVPVVFSLVVCAYGSAIALSETAVTVRQVRVLGLAFSLVLVVTLANTGNIVDWAKTDNVNPHLRAYYETADFLTSAAPQGAVVETAEPGSLAFRLGPKFTVVDELGLTTPGVAEASLDGDNTYANRTYKADYLICSWTGTYSACSHPEVMANYRLVGEFDEEFWKPRVDRGALVYQRIRK